MVELLKRCSRANKAVLAAGLLSAATAMPAAASDNITVTVSANIVGVCKFFNGPYTIKIANSGLDIDPAVSTTATGSANVEYRCSNGTSPSFTVPTTVTLNGPASATMNAAISYLGGGDGTGMGAGQGKTLKVTGDILQADYENKPVGSYSNTIRIDINP